MGYLPFGTKVVPLLYERTRGRYSFQICKCFTFNRHGTFAKIVENFGCMF